MIENAIILAGGKGERLRPLTLDRPKPMVELLGRPILDYEIEWLKKAGVKNIVIACSYKKEVIKDHFKDGSHLDLNIQYSEEDTPLGSAGAVNQAMSYLPPSWENSIVMNGDNIIDLDWLKLGDKHLKKDADVTLVMTQLKSPYGIVEFNDSEEITGFKEKPMLPHWINAGIYVFSKNVLKLLPEVGSLEFDVFPKLKQEKFIAYKNPGYWRGVDTVKDLTEAEKEFKQVFA